MAKTAVQSSRKGMHFSRAVLVIVNLEAMAMGVDKVPVPFRTASSRFAH